MSVDRVVQAEERVEVLAPLGLGDDLAVPLLVEAVEHHAVEAGQLAHAPDGDLEQALVGEALVELGQRRLRAPVGVRERQRARTALLAQELGDERPVAVVHERVEAHAQRQEGGPALRAARGGADLGGGVDADERAELGPDRGLGPVPKKSAQLAEATITWSVAGSIASRQPWGWIEPGMWIGSRWQLSRSTSSPVGR